MNRAMAAASLLLSGLASGCVELGGAGREPTRFFVLTSSSVAPADAGPDAALDRLGVRIETVWTPEYLQTSKIAVRVGANEVEFTELDRWAEPVSVGLVRVLKENLEAFPEIRTVRVAPFRREDRSEYSLSLSVRRFEADRGDPDDARARFDLRWTLRSETAGREVSGRHRSLEPWDGESFGALAATFSESIAELSRTLVEAMLEG